MMSDSYYDDVSSYYADDELSNPDVDQIIRFTDYAQVNDDACQTKIAREAVFVGRDDSNRENKIINSTQEYSAKEVFPAYPADERRVPNLLVRSSLFSATETNHKRYCDNERLVMWGDKPDQSVSRWEMFYSGEQLDQHDLAVFESILYLAGSRRVGRPFRVNAKKILDGMGLKSNGGGNIRRLKQRLIRLASCELTIIDREIEAEMFLHRLYADDYPTAAEFILYQQTVFRGSLIELDDPLKPYSITLSLGIKKLCEHYTKLNCAVLKELSSAPLASWLYHYFASHKQSKTPMVFQYGLDTLSWLSGTSLFPLDEYDNESAFKRFKRTLLKSLIALRTETGKVGRPFTYVQSAWDNGNVAIIK